MAKDSLFRAPVLGYIMRKLAHIPVVRGSVDARKSLITARKIVEAGGAVVIFPEGTTTHDPQLWPMQARTGAARLALATGAPVYPWRTGVTSRFSVTWMRLARTAASRRSVRISLFPRKTVRVQVGKALDIAYPR